MNRRGPSRRAVLTGMAGTFAALAWAPGLAPRATADPGDSQDFAAARGRWSDLILGSGGATSDPRVADALAGVDDDAAAVRAHLTSSDTQVFDDMPLVDEGAMWKSYTRLVTLATAWATPGSQFENKTAVRDEILEGMRIVHKQMYNPDHEESGNWWNWEIGASRASMDLCVLMYDEMDPAERQAYVETVAHFVPDPTLQFLDPARRTASEGANRVDLCRAVAISGIVSEDSARVDQARDGLSDVFAYVTTSNGLYRDGSFIQHDTIAYTGSYGQVLLDGLSRLFVVLAASPWAVTDPDVEIIYRSVTEAFAPVIADARMMDFVRGRSVSRDGEGDASYGYLVIEAILRLATAVAETSPERAEQWRGLSKGWLTRASAELDVFAGADMPRASAFSQLLDDQSVKALAEGDGTKIFGSMDRVVHRQDGWALAISMASRRISYYETGNGENLRGFHTGDGMTYLYDGDLEQFSDGFWPTVDPYRLPGTTVDSKPLPDKAGGEWGAAKPASATWVGGAAADGYASIGMHLQGLQSTLEARKSWFIFKDVIVNLGAGITGGGPDHSVETIIENRNLHAGKSPKFLVNGHDHSTFSDEEQIADATWAHLEGVGGFAFPEPTEVTTMRHQRSGAWSDININGPEDKLTRPYQALWLDHGIQPEAAGYAYAQLPGASSAATEKFADSFTDTITILANDSSIQAVRDNASNTTTINFWGGGRSADQTLPASADAYVNDGAKAADNFAEKTVMFVKNVRKPDSGYSRQTFVQFDIPTELDLDNLSAATVRLWIRVNDSKGDTAEVNVVSVPSGFDEETLTWNTKPDLGDELDSFTVTSDFAWYDVPVLDQLREAAEAGKPLALAIVEPDDPDADGLSVEISSREHKTNGPQLVLEAPPQPMTLGGYAAASPCAVVVRAIDQQHVVVALSDPTHTQQTVQLSLQMPEYEGYESDEEVTVEAADDEITVRFDVAGSAGATHLVTLLGQAPESSDDATAQGAGETGDAASAASGNGGNTDASAAAGNGGNEASGNAASGTGASSSAASSDGTNGSNAGVGASASGANGTAGPSAGGNAGAGAATDSTSNGLADTGVSAPGLATMTFGAVAAAAAGSTMLSRRRSASAGAPTGTAAAPTEFLGNAGENAVEIADGDRPGSVGQK